MWISSDWLMIKDNKVLLVKRARYKAKYFWCWTVPWWWMESWETPEENVIREVKEETNLDYKPTQLFKKVDKWEKNGRPRIQYCFIWEFSWEIKLQEEEATDYGWFTYEETKNLKLAFNFEDILEELNKKGYF
jgi:ADP-ribose pyrophosphatase YjhB (NUDIX family)